MNASKAADEEGRKLFLGGLPFDATENDLRKDFGEYGELEDVQLPMGDSGTKHKGFAFITYRSKDDCRYASEKHHQKNYMGREISAKVVVPRADRTGGDREGPRPGDWSCDKCGASVFGSKSECFKCGNPKSSQGGGGSRDGGWRPRSSERRRSPSPDRRDRYRDDRRYDDRRDDRRYDDRRDDRRYDDRRDDRRYDDRR